MAAPYTTGEMVDMFIIYCRAQKDVTLARRLYAEQFPKRNIPPPEFFEEINQTLYQTGSVPKSQVEE